MDPIMNLALFLDLRIRKRQTRRTSPGDAQAEFNPAADGSAPEKAGQDQQEEAMFFTCQASDGSVEPQDQKNYPTAMAASYTSGQFTSQKTGVLSTPRSVRPKPPAGDFG